MLPLAAYADRLSVRPGASIKFKVANATGFPVSARVVRVVSADPNPAGPGIRIEPVAANLSQRCDPGPAAVPMGSYAAVSGVESWLSGESFTLACRMQPKLLNGRAQSLLSRLEDGENRGFGLMLDNDGHLLGVMGNGAALEGPRGEQALLEQRWYLVWLRFEAGGRSLQVGQIRLGIGMQENDAAQTVDHALSAGASPLGNGPLLMAAANAGSPGKHFNGKLERPTLWDRALSVSEIERLAMGEDPEGMVACWDFSQWISLNRIADTGPNGVHGELFNSPARGMTGSTWSGREMCYRHALSEYAAIQFHEDDLDDCAWPTAFEWTVPEGTRSSIYALALSAGDAEENVPFHVVPPRGRPTAKVAVLASTFTYTVYGNHARPEWNADPAWRKAWLQQTEAWGGYPHNPGAHPEYGLSTYNWHPDRSGISIASWHRPMLNLRLGYLTFPHENIRGSGLRHFPADTHLIAWLEDKGHRYDIITDWELHHEGIGLLENYPVLLTGSHPEYHTREMLDTLTAYRDSGGRFCYLGGNGFYWKIALSPNKDGVIEIRRAEGGIRAWAAESGEYYNQFDGEYGGMWRRNGRPPQHLCGIGFTAQGNFSGSRYRKRPEAADPRVSWIFEGIDEETFGDHGLSAHGAAGYELDRADKRLGTPEHALVIASSEDHPPEAPWVLVPEEILTHLVTWPGEPAHDLIRADMTYFETPGGGAVFSTGSITFCGSLVSNGFDNDVSRLLDNVLRRFLNPAPLGIGPA